MALEWDPILFVNLLLCIAIVVLGFLCFRKSGEMLPAFIGAAFGLFGISHAATLAGLKVPLIPEWIHNGENGVLIPTGDRETLADQILLLAENPSLRREYGMKSREIVVRGADWETLMFTAEEDYKDLIKRFKRKTMHFTDET